MAELIFTPRPCPTESLLGYVLRVAERNGYDSPWHILTHAGFDQREMQTAAFPVEKVARILARSPDELQHLSNCHSLPDGSREYCILGNSLGESLSYTPLRLHQPAFCPSCVKEDGILDAAWDVSLMVACPKHRRLLLERCPACQQKLRWFRPGMLACKCGADLSSAVTSEADQGVVDLMNILFHKIHSVEMVDAEAQSGLPIHELTRLSLKDLLKVLAKLGQFECISHGVTEQPTVLEKVQGAVALLADWPNGFHRFLRRYDETVNGGALAAIGLHKRFAKFSNVIVGRGYCKDAQFIRDEFLRFGLHEWGEGIVDRKGVKGMEYQPRYVSANVLAKQLNVRPITLVSWGKRGLIPMKTFASGRRVRYVFDSVSHPTIKAGAGRCFPMRDAAAYIDLPVSVLKAIIYSKSFSSQNKARFKMGVHEADLDVLRDRLLNRAALLDKSSQLAPAKTMSLHYFMQEKRLHSKTGKADFLIAFLSGDIEAVGRTNDEVGTILFDLEVVADYAKKHRADLKPSLISFEEAAALLGCQYYGVMNLVRHAYLDTVPWRSQTCVRRRSVASFLTTYAVLPRIAKSRKTTTRRLVNLAKGASIPVISVPGEPYPPTYLIAMEYRHALMDQLDNLEKKRIAKRAKLRGMPKAAQEASVLRRYFDDLSASGKAMPRRAGQPNKKAIARACDMPRDRLYDNPELISMINAYDADERNRAGVCIREDASTQLKRYLQELSSRNAYLPLRAGKPNLQQIAKACGINRNAFYNYPGLLGILQKFNRRSQSDGQIKADSVNAQ